MKFCTFVSINSFMLLTFLFSFSLAADEETIVVWRIEAQTGVSDKEADAISGIVTAEVGRVSGKKTVSENEMRALLVGEEIKMSCGAEDSVCIAEIGAALGAPESVTGTISKMGDYWMLTLQRLNVRRVEVISRYEDRISGGVNTLIETVPVAVRSLFPENVVEVHEPAVTERQEKRVKSAKDRKKLSMLGHTGIGFMVVGAAMTGFGGISHWKMGVEKSKYRKGETAGDLSKYNSWKASAIVSYSIGGAAMVAGLVLLVVDLTKDPPVKVTALPVPGGAYFELGWSW